MNVYHFWIGIIGLFLLGGCGGPSEKDQSTEFEAKIHLAGDPKSLNPFTSIESRSVTVNGKLFQTLLNLDYKTTEMVPVLAQSRPTIQHIGGSQEGDIKITFQLRPEARWDNGLPITARDVIFSLKAMTNPYVKSHSLRPYFEFIDSARLYSDRPRKVTFYSDTPYILAEAAFCDLPILPAHTYDPDSLLRQFTVHQLSELPPHVKNDTLLQQFAKSFNSTKHQRKPQYVNGSGPYRFQKWENGQKIVLQRKQEWWGDRVTPSAHHYFEAHPEQLTYKIIKDRSTALVALKDEQLDVLTSIPARKFKKLPESKSFRKNFQRYSPSTPSFSYIGVNTQQPELKDASVRKALAYLTPVDQIIKTVSRGLAQRVVGPIPPQNKKSYNDTLTPYPYNPEKARALLTKAGWEDSNQNSTVDKRINGQVHELELDYLFPAGNDNAKNIGLILKKAAQKAGVTINIQSLEASVVIQKLKQHEFDLYVSAWSFPPQPFDPKQLFHTSAIQGGSNFVGFGNVKTDRLIENIRHTIEEEKRAHLYRKLQAILHREVPYIFLLSPQRKIAIHKRFDNIFPSVLHPGYWSPAFKLSANAQGS